VRTGRETIQGLARDRHKAVVLAAKAVVMLGFIRKKTHAEGRFSFDLH